MLDEQYRKTASIIPDCFSGFFLCFDRRCKIQKALIFFVDSLLKLRRVLCDKICYFSSMIMRESWKSVRCPIRSE